MMDWIQTQLIQNQIAAGGLVVILGSSVLYFTRNIPLFLWKRSLRFFLITVEVRQPDPLYDWVGEWMRDISNRANRLSGVTIKRGENSRLEIMLVPGIGGHLFFYDRRLFLLKRDREDSTSTEKFLQRESYIIFGYRNSRKTIMKMLEDIRSTQLSKEGSGPDVYMAEEWGNWERISRTEPRKLSSVIMKGDLVQELLDQCRYFLSHKEYYAERGIPWRTGILLHGPPGNGKTSLITALAHELDLAIGILNLTIEGMTDNSLIKLFGNSKGMLVVIEDIDSIYTVRDKNEAAKNISFSGLLNAIDGVTAGQGHIIIMTTNHIEKLDAALIRKGRIDLQISIGEPDEEQLFKLWKLFRSNLDGRENFVKKHIGGSMSNAQNDLIKEIK